MKFKLGQQIIDKLRRKTKENINNKIHINNNANKKPKANTILNITGDNNTVIIKKPYDINALSITVENLMNINNSTIFINEGFSTNIVTVMLYQHRFSLIINKDCMMSRDVELKLGEFHHVIFDKETGEYLDKPVKTKIGNHAWIGKTLGY